jgi:hypothetical protein
MVKQIIADTFETLGQTAGQAVKQTAQEPIKILEKAGQQIGMTSAGVNEGAKQSQPSPEAGISQAQIQSKNAGVRKRLTYLEEELRQIQAQKREELPKQVSGKPGFSEDKMIRQFELEKKKELPPVVVQAKNKASAEKRQFGGG